MIIQKDAMSGRCIMMHCNNDYWDRRYEWRQEEYQADGRRMEASELWNRHSNDIMKMKGQEYHPCPFPACFLDTERETDAQLVSAGA